MFFCRKEPILRKFIGKIARNHWLKCNISCSADAIEAEKPVLCGKNLRWPCFLVWGVTCLSLKSRLNRNVTVHAHPNQTPLRGKLQTQTPPDLQKVVFNSNSFAPQRPREREMFCGGKCWFAGSEG